MADEETSEGQPSASGSEGAATPDEEQMRAAYEEQIKQVRVQDLILQSAVSILQLSARRIAKEDEKDLEQARAGIDAANDLLDHVPEETQAELRQAVSELQMLYAQHAGGDGGSDEGGGDGGGEPEPKPAPKPSAGDSGLWTPGS